MQWDSRVFNYGSWEVLRFLLSNLRFVIYAISIQYRTHDMRAAGSLRSTASTAFALMA